MQIQQNDMEHILDLLEQGKITADEANIRKIEMQRVLLVRSRIPASVRKALNTGVKAGRLVHRKKDGRKPEVYFKTGFEFLVNEEIARYERLVVDAIAKTCDGSLDINSLMGTEKE